MSLTTQDILTVGASYWLRQRADGSGPNVSALVRDTGLSRETVKAAVDKLEKDHKDWLAEYGELVIADARKELVSDAFTRIRTRINNFAGRVIDKTEENFFKLHESCMAVALAGKAKNEDEFQALKVKQFERRACLGILRQAVSMAQELESAAKPPQGGPVGSQTFNFGLDENQKKKLGEAIERSRNRIDAVSQNGN